MQRRQSAVPEPPSPPSVGRGVRFGPLQAAGLVLIVAIPVLALLGLFGESTAELSATLPDLEVHITYPARTRYQTGSAVQVTVRNITSLPLEDLTVRFGRHYLEGFADVKFTPAVDVVTEEGYEVRLSGIPAGASRVVSVSVLAEEYWCRRGTVTVERAGAEPLRFQLETFVFP